MSRPAQWTRRLRAVLDHPRPLRFLLGQFFWRTGLGRWITFPVGHFRLRLFPTNLSWQLWLDPSSRAETLDLVHRLLRPGETLVDVGANIGSVSLEGAHAVGPSGTVHAIEPHPRILRHLRSNLELNRATQVKCHPVAIGAEPGRLSLTDDRRDDMNHLQAPETGRSGIPVPVVPLDDLLPSLDRCHLLKIDVEGRELECLRGARRLLARTDCVLVEAGDSNSARFGLSAAGLFEDLTREGFAVFTWRNGELQPVRPEADHRSVDDWIAARDAATLRQRLAA